MTKVNQWQSVPALSPGTHCTGGSILAWFLGQVVQNLRASTVLSLKWVQPWQKKVTLIPTPQYKPRPPAGPQRSFVLMTIFLAHLLHCKDRALQHQVRSFIIFSTNWKQVLFQALVLCFAECEVSIIQSFSEGMWLLKHVTNWTSGMVRFKSLFIS